MVRNKIFSVSHQLALLKAKYGGQSTSYPSKFVWLCNFTPTALSNTYKLKIEYKQGQKPLVYIVAPKPLPLANGAKRLPHTFDTKKQRLCLFIGHEWNSGKLICDTIIHWAVQWMLYYESWRYTGAWLGEGHGNWDAIVSDEQSKDLNECSKKRFKATIGR